MAHWWQKGGAWNPTNWDGDDLTGVLSGAGTGFLAGGPVGAVVGGYAGGVASESMDDANKSAHDEKRQGYDQVIARAEQLKQERMARKDRTYEMADEKYRPTRAALAAVYGDPESWKL